MSSPMPSASPSLIFSSPQVAGQPLPPLEVSDNCGKWLSNSWLALSPLSTSSWDTESVRCSDKDESSRSSAVETSIWDSPDLLESPLKSVFEDWDDDSIPGPKIPTIIVEEDDGAQTVIINPQSPFFSPPTPPRLPGSGDSRLPINLSPSSIARRDVIPDEVPTSPVSPSPSILESQRRRREQLDQPVKDQMLFVITASLQGGFALSSSPFYSLQPVDKAEVTSWAPKGLMQGPDVPLDCTYRGREISPMGQHCQWDERPWCLPHTVPCSSAF